MIEKKKVLVIADSPLVPSGVGTQTKYMIESLIKTGKYKFLCLAGAIKHQDYRMQKVEPWFEDWLILPVDGYGNQEMIRSLLRDYKPDVLWFMTDPRFYIWLWEMENEIRPNVPMIYYHVWDNFPYPTFNKNFYKSNDFIASISKVTDDIVKTVVPDVKSRRVPHTVDTGIFKKYSKEDDLLVRSAAACEDPDKLIFFWNNRNARRKQSGTLIYWFKEFLDRVGHDKATLLMHTDPFDVHGQNLNVIIQHLGIDQGQVLLSTQKTPAESLALIYNAVDCTINISDAEGFGLATLESLSCGTPIIVNMTGGLQEQVTDGENWFGIGIEPSSKAIIGSQDVPYIYEDRLNKEDFIDALTKMLEMSPEERDALGQAGRQHVQNNYSFDQFRQDWISVMDDVVEKNGSWETRKNYKTYEFTEL